MHFEGWCGADTQRATLRLSNRSDEVSTAQRLSQLRLHDPEVISSNLTMCKGNVCSRSSCTTIAALPQAFAATSCVRSCSGFVQCTCNFRLSSCSCLEGRGLGALATCKAHVVLKIARTRYNGLSRVQTPVCQYVTECVCRDSCSCHAPARAMTKIRSCDYTHAA